MKATTVNKWKDLAERVGWTFIQAEIALGLLDWLAGGFNLNFLHQLYASLGAAAVATIKVLLAQGMGHSNSGSLPDTTKGG
jgi:hypothetical protein